jgi:hypothetical protein
MLEESKDPLQSGFTHGLSLFLDAVPFRVGVVLPVFMDPRLTALSFSWGHKEDKRDPAHHS